MSPLLPIAAILIVLAISGIRIAQEYERGVVFRLGRFSGLRGPGLFWIVPLGVERAVIVDIRTRTVSAEQQETITRDSVTIRVNAVLWYRITDAGKSVIAVSEAASAVYQLALTGLRNIIGQHDLDEVLQERDKINELLRQSIMEFDYAMGNRGRTFRNEGCRTARSDAASGWRCRPRPSAKSGPALSRPRRNFGASEKLAAASAMMAGNPAALELRRGMQMISGSGIREQQHGGVDDSRGFRDALYFAQRLSPTADAQEGLTAAEYLRRLCISQS